MAGLLRQPSSEVSRHLFNHLPLPRHAGAVPTRAGPTPSLEMAKKANLLRAIAGCPGKLGN